MFSTRLWCSSRSRTAEAMTVSPSSSPHSPNPLLEVRMILPRSYLADTKVKKAVADSRS